MSTAPAESRFARGQRVRLARSPRLTGRVTDHWTYPCQPYPGALGVDVTMDNQFSPAPTPARYHVLEKDFEPLPPSYLDDTEAMERLADIITHIPGNWAAAARMARGRWRSCAATNGPDPARRTADMETRPMKPGELGRYVCVAHGGCLHSPKITITADGVWVRSPDPDPLNPGSHLYSSAHRDCFEAWQARDRLESLRAALRSEDISYGELAELQSLAPYIEAGDAELLEAAGVPESPVCRYCGKALYEFEGALFASYPDPGCPAAICKQAPAGPDPRHPRYPSHAIANQEN